MEPAQTARVRSLNTDIWRCATWLVPVVFQAVLALTAGVMWLLSKGPLGGRNDFGTFVLTGGIITTVMALLAGGYLSRPGGSARRRAAGLSIIGSGVAVFIGAAAYAFWLLPWLEYGD